MRLLSWRGSERHSRTAAHSQSSSNGHLASRGSSLSTPVRVLSLLAAAALLQTAGNFRYVSSHLILFKLSHYIGCIIFCVIRIKTTRRNKNVFVIKLKFKINVDNLS